VITLLGIPFLAIIVVFQSAVISRMNVSNGTADLVLLVLLAWALQAPDRKVLWWAFIGGIFVSIITATPSIAIISGYLLVTFLASIIKIRLWNIPIITISIFKARLPFAESFIQVIIPSCALNMFLGIPIFLIVKDIVDSVYPVENL
jgi:cell shape-determining protein MreD